MDFKEKVFKITQKIPKGKVSTYKEIAGAVGRSKASRAVGNALNDNKSKMVSCHRVVRSDGFVGGFNRGSREKIRKLKNEGVEIMNGKVDLDKYLYKL
ncbi:MAG: MGMT family protein [Parcubacteria group bacterium]|nr:MGMT family protein [Parcubacteria group bacterium]